MFSFSLLIEILRSVAWTLSAPAANDVPGAAVIVGREQARRPTAAVAQQDEPVSAGEGRGAAAEVDLRARDRRLGGPAGAAVASDVQGAAALPEDAEAVAREGDAFGVAVTGEPAVQLRARGGDRGCAGLPASSAVARAEDGLLFVAGAGLTEADDPAEPVGDEVEERRIGDCPVAGTRPPLPASPTVSGRDNGEREVPVDHGAASGEPDQRRREAGREAQPVPAPMPAAVQRVKRTTAGGGDRTVSAGRLKCEHRSPCAQDDPPATASVRRQLDRPGAALRRQLAVAGAEQAATRIPERDGDQYRRRRRRRCGDHQPIIAAARSWRPCTCAEPCLA